MTAPEVTVALVLAAGRSSRFSGDKLLHPLAGKPLAAHVADRLAAMAFSHRLAVCPAGAEDRAALFRSRGFEIIENFDPDEGMGHSLALGARRALELGAEAMIVCLADMPYVTEAHICALLAASVDAAATVSGGTKSPPAAFGKSFLPQLARLSGDSGARDLLRHAALVEAEPKLVRDFDTPADFER